MAVRDLSPNEIFNQWWADGIPLGTPGGASGSVMHIGSATVYIAAGESHVGEIGANTAIKEVIFTLDTSAYASGDVLASTQPIADAMRKAGGTGIIQTVTVLDKDDQGQPFDILFMRTNATLGAAENAALAIGDTQAAEVLGVVEILASDYVDLVNSQIATKANVGIVVKPTAATTSLWTAGVSKGTGTYTGTGIIMQASILRD